MKNIRIQILSGMSILMGLISIEARAENLAQIFSLAQENDPQFLAAAAEQKAVQESRSQSIAALLPSLSASASYAETEQETVGGFSPGNYETTNKSYNLTLTQPIYHHDYYVQLRQSNARVAQAAATFRNAEQALLLRVAERYFEYLGAMDNLAFAQAEKKSIGEQLNQTKQRFKVGLTAITDVHEAQARYDLAVAQTISAENSLAVSRENLRELTGQEHKQLSPLSVRSPLIPPEPQNIHEWVKTAIAQSLDLIVAEKNMYIAQEEVNRLRAGHYPTLDFVADQGFSDNEGGSSFSPTETDDLTLSLRLNVPLYQGGLVSSRTREAGYRYQQNKQLYELQRRTTERLTRSSYLSVIANISQVKAYKQALASSKTALEATQAGFEVGTRTAVDVLDSQRELFRAERDYARSRYTYIIETFRLKQATGILTASDVRRVNSWLR